MKKKYFYFCILLFLFLIIVWWAVQIKQGKLPYIDQLTRNFVAVVAHTPVYTFFRWITELGSRSFTVPFTIVMSLVLWRLYRDWFLALLFGLGTWGAHLLNHWIKHLVARERPSISALLNAQGFSFPSGHAMISIVCYGLLGYLLSKKINSKQIRTYVQIIFGLLILLIGSSRYFINVHFLTDIITGFLVGYLYLLLLIYVYEKV